MRVPTLCHCIQSQLKPEDPQHVAFQPRVASLPITTQGIECHSYSPPLAAELLSIARARSLLYHRLSLFGTLTGSMSRHCRFKRLADEVAQDGTLPWKLKELLVKVLKDEEAVRYVSALNYSPDLITFQQWFEAPPRSNYWSPSERQQMPDVFSSSVWLRTSESQLTQLGGRTF